VFVLNNLSSSAQAVAKGVIIVLAVLLQTRLAEGGGPGSWFGRRRSPASAGGPASTGAASGDVSGGTSVPGAPGGNRPGGSADTP
jgi:ribose transport system permease protein